MTGITDNIEKILPVLSEAECLKGWTLVGGTALAIQIGHRESEDLDFMKWNFKGDCLARDKKGTYCNLRQRA